MVAKAKKKAASLTKPTFTPKTLEFMRQYVLMSAHSTEIPNGREAAIRAGYAPKSASVTASKLLKKANIAECISTALARIAEKQEVRAGDVVRETRNIAFSNILDYLVFDEFGNPEFCINSIDRDKGSVIKKFKTKTSYKVDKIGRVTEKVVECEVELFDKLKALDKLDAATKAFPKMVSEMAGDQSLRPIILVNTGIDGSPGSAMKKKSARLVGLDE